MSRDAGRRCRGAPPARADGFTYLAVLFLVVLMGVGLATIAQVWHTMAQRDKEAELLFVGSQFRDAITRYYNSSPGKPELPKALEDLLQDKRLPTTRRYLRKLFVDPMTGKADWGLVLAGDRIVGVHSVSKDKPVKERGFTVANAAFEGKISYEQWEFVLQGVPDQNQTAPAAPNAALPALAADASAASEAPTDKASQCAAQRTRDLAQCSGVTAREGSAAGGACNLAAGRRFMTCVAGDAVPTRTGIN